jgi:DNA-directed RNA polymerase specialized sigma24 family protein
MSHNTKARSDALQQAAQRLLEEHQVNVLQQVHYLPLAQELRSRTGCHIDTAKQHIMKAVRRKRGEFSESQWGGVRPGSGRPPKGEENVL